MASRVKAVFLSGDQAIGQMDSTDDISEVVFCDPLLLPPLI